nr:recombination-associated protein RdgC [Deltaproteobacteria bacterium]
MGLLSSAVSVNRYQVEGDLKEPLMENIVQGLRLNAFRELDDLEEKSVGWTPFGKPFSPKFDGSSCMIGSLLVFSLRIDRKTVPPKVFKKHFALESEQYLQKSRRSFLTREEKEMLKEKVLADLRSRIPAVPETYDLVWQYESRSLWFFSLLKAVNEELETLFAQSFNLTLIRLFPFTLGDLAMGLSLEERDVLVKLNPMVLAE